MKFIRDAMVPEKIATIFTLLEWLRLQVQSQTMQNSIATLACCFHYWSRFFPKQVVGLIKEDDNSTFSNTIQYAVQHFEYLWHIARKLQLRVKTVIQICKDIKNLSLFFSYVCLLWVTTKNQFYSCILCLCLTCAAILFQFVCDFWFPIPLDFTKQR